MKSVAGDQSLPLQVYRSRTYLIVVFGLALGLGVGAFLLVPRTNPIMIVVFGLLAILLAATSLVAWTKRNPVITIDAAGIRLHPCIGAKVTWDKVVNVQVDWQPHVGRILYVDVAADDPWAASIDSMRCTAKLVAEQPRVIRIGMTLEGLDTSEARLLAAIRSHLADR